MTEIFKKGDVVRLKSGGPDMTVIDPGDSFAGTNAFCAWFANGVHCDDEFPIEALEKVPPRKSASRVRRS